MTDNLNPVENVEVQEAPVNTEVKKSKPPKNPLIQNDIMRYKKNKLGANLMLLGLALGCLYFLVLYAQCTKQFNNYHWYKWSIAFDVIYNLFFMLFVFLFSEQVKSYNSKLFPMQVIVGALQVARIFWLPLSGLTTNIAEGQPVLAWGSFLAMTIFLAASGACIIAGAVIGLIRAKNVESFTKKVESGEIDIDEELKKEDNNVGGEVNA
ncbi:MAG: hypothetical protein HDQ88_10980 [Clostridia bacterium]|nr:hypothetical protein [Clostridia bacterium]